MNSIYKAKQAALNNPHLILLAILLCACAYTWLTAISQHPLNPDAGYYLSAGKQIASGAMPFIDFHTSYSPGTYFIFALGDMFGSSFGEFQKATIYFIHVLNGVVLGCILLRLNYQRDLAFIGGAILILASFCLDGQEIVLEPFQNLFLLLSLYTALNRSNRSLVAAGFFAGCALMCKQTSMLSLPIIAAIIAFPRLLQLSTEQPIIKETIRRLVLFGASISVPFIIFCVTTGQSFIDAFYTLATFGGRAKSYVELKYGLYDVVDTFLNRTNGQQLLIPAIIVAITVLLISKNNLHRLFAVGLGINLLTVLFVRGYPHYIQLIIPWAILLMMALIQLLSLPTKQARSVLMVILMIPLVATVLSNTHNLRKAYAKAPLEEQKTLSNNIQQAIDPTLDTIIVGHPWLYYTLNMSVLDNNFDFITVEYKLRNIIDRVDQIIVMPAHQSLFHNVIDDFPAQRFRLVHETQYHNEEVAVFQRQ